MQKHAYVTLVDLILVSQSVKILTSQEIKTGYFFEEVNNQANYFFEIIFNFTHFIYVYK